MRREPVENNLILLCRAGFERVLREEIAARLVSGAHADQFSLLEGEGMVTLSGLPARARGLLWPPLMFERQRLPRPLWLSRSNKEGGLHGRIAGLFLSSITGSPHPWSIHAFAPELSGAGAAAGRAGRLEENLLEQWIKNEPRLSPRYRSPGGSPPGRDCQVLQLCLLKEGLWAALAPAVELSATAPGGIHRIEGDPEAPSRSHLKIEEAFLHMGASPRARERVIDLGAAPGGWSHAFLKRGCRVLAVDNGALKIRNPEEMAGTLEHRRADGLGFRPPPGWAPVDWLVSDMLVAPGKSLGLLRRWLAGGWMERFVINLKLPQLNPLAALQPIEAFLSAQPRVEFTIRQLYHDRKEVTLMGRAAPDTNALKPTQRRRRRGK